MKFKFHYVVLAVGIVAAAAYFSAEVFIGTQKEIRCDKFRVQATRHNDQLSVSIDTDCPDFASIMVSVSRVYYEKGSDTAYQHSYFESQSTVGEWRKPRHISVPHSKWNRIVKAHQEKMARMGMGYEVDRVDKYINVSFILPINQKDKRFSPNNENLVGNAVNKNGLRIVEDEAKLLYPLDDDSVGKVRLPSTNPYSLDHKQYYKIARKIPLMPVLLPRRPMAELNRVRYIPAGYIIEIIGRSNIHTSPWYKVIVRNGHGMRWGAGWVNSVALLGQKLEPVRH